MKYKLLISRRAQKELAGFEGDPYERIKEAIQSLEENPRPSGCKKLAGREGWRIRVGSYRVIYEIDDDQGIVSIFHIGHRKDVYL